MLLEGVPASRAASHLAYLLGVFVAYALVTLVVVSLFPGLKPGATPTVADQLVSFAISQLGFVIMIVAAWGLLRSIGVGMDAVGLTRSRLGDNLLLGVPVAAASFGAAALSVGLVWVFRPEILVLLQDNVKLIETFVPNIHLGLLLLVMIVIATTEEVLFRGIVLSHLRRITGSWTIATVLSAAVFAIPHAITQEVATCVPLFAMAVLLSAVTIWRRSLVPAIVGHALFNFFQVGYIFLYLDGK